MLTKLLNDDGQDLIEYALLTSIIGIAGVLLLPGIQTKMASAFSGWVSSVQAIWVPNDP